MNQSHHEFNDTDRQLLRHFLATLAYRTQKAVRDAPDDFANYHAAPGVRTPHQLLRHMSDVLGYALTMLGGGSSRARTLPGFVDEIARFHQVLEALSQAIETTSLGSVTPGQLLQGPLADAMTHAGQLAMLRRLSGSPIPPENFSVAQIDADNLGADQPTATSKDADWYDAEDEPW